MKDFFIAVAFACLILALSWFGFVEDVEGAKNGARFIVWVIMLPLILLSLHDDAIKRSAAQWKERPRVAVMIVRAINSLAVCCMVFGGGLFTAAAWLLVLVLGAARSEMVRKYLEAQDQAKEPAGAPV